MPEDRFYINKSYFLVMGDGSDKHPQKDLIDWAKMWHGTMGSVKPEPAKPEDPRSEALGRAMRADKPLDSYARKS